MMDKKHIIIAGVPRSGKTTLSSMLARFFKISAFGNGYNYYGI